MSDARLELGPDLSVSWEADGWSLEGSLEPAWSALRVLTGELGDGARVLLAGARPSGATAHDEETVRAVIVRPSGETEEIYEVLLSTEYAADGSVRRVGMELYPEGEDYPHRAAADTREARRGEEGDRRTEVAEMELRMNGVAGRATHELLRP